MNNEMLKLAMTNDSLKVLVNDETRKLVGYIMPVLESMEADENQKSLIKKILYSYKNNLCEMLINEMLNERHDRNGF